jgi:hypothetical protein
VSAGVLSFEGSGRGRIATPATLYEWAAPWGVYLVSVLQLASHPVLETWTAMLDLGNACQAGVLRV